jgi:hypothetical protein
MDLRRHHRAALALVALLPLQACVDQPSAQTKAAMIQPTQASSATITSATVGDSAQPNVATYACADGGMMTIENLGTSLKLMGPDGVAEEMPASPANQKSRYGAEHDAIVLDGKEALVMKAGQTPLTCTR